MQDKEIEAILKYNKGIVHYYGHFHVGKSEYMKGIKHICVGMDKSEYVNLN